MYTTKIFNFEYNLPCSKSLSSNKGLDIKGSACIYNIIDEHNDVILPGAFDEYIDSLKSISGWNKLPHMYYEHKPSIKPGKWFYINNSIDELKVEGILYSKDIIQDVLMGKINSLSIGFYIQNAEMKNDIRIIKKAFLIEVSIVNMPANSKAYFTTKEKLDMTISSYLKA